MNITMLAIPAAAVPAVAAVAMVAVLAVRPPNKMLLKW